MYLYLTIYDSVLSTVGNIQLTELRPPIGNLSRLIHPTCNVSRSTHILIYS